MAEPADAQRRAQRPESLRGSRTSVEKMYEFARANRLAFYLTPTNIQHAVAAGKLVPLEGDSTYELTSAVGFSYATPEARQFVREFAPQYLAACGTPLTVTSAARPTSRQPRNASPQSVHATGIAIDLRRPNAGPCQTWLRNALAELEARGFIEATEERRPVHMHVAVLTVPGRVATLPRLVHGQLAARPAPREPQRAAEAPANGAPSTRRAPIAAPRARTYRVREGDTLWDVARKAGVTVEELARANNRNPRAVLRPGVTLTLPTTR